METDIDESIRAPLEDKPEPTSVSAREEYLRSWIKKGEPRKKYEKQNLKQFVPIEQLNLGANKKDAKIEKKSILKRISSFFSFRKIDMNSKLLPPQDRKTSVKAQTDERVIKLYNSKNFKKSQESGTVLKCSSSTESQPQPLTDVTNTSEDLGKLGEREGKVSKESMSTVEGDKGGGRASCRVTRNVSRGSQTTDWWSNDEEPSETTRRQSRGVGRNEARKEDVAIECCNISEGINSVAIQTETSATRSWNKKVKKKKRENKSTEYDNPYLENIIIDIKRPLKNKIKNQKYYKLEKNIILSKKSIATLLQQSYDKHKIRVVNSKFKTQLHLKRKCERTPKKEKRKRGKKNLCKYCQNSGKFNHKPKSTSSHYEKEIHNIVWDRQNSWSSTEDCRRKETRKNKKNKGNKITFSEESPVMEKNECPEECSSRKKCKSKGRKFNDRSMPILPNRDEKGRIVDNRREKSSISKRSESLSSLYEEQERQDQQTKRREEERKKDDEMKRRMLKRSYNSEPGKSSLKKPGNQIWSKGSTSDVSSQSAVKESGKHLQQKQARVLRMACNTLKETMPRGRMQESNSISNRQRNEKWDNCISHKQDPFVYKTEIHRDSETNTNVKRFDSSASNVFGRKYKNFKEIKISNEQVNKSYIDYVSSLFGTEPKNKLKQFCQGFNCRDASEPSVSSMQGSSSQNTVPSDLPNYFSKNHNPHTKTNINHSFPNTKNVKKLCRNDVLLTSPSNTMKASMKGGYSEQIKESEINKSLEEDRKMYIKEFERVMREIFKIRRKKSQRFINDPMGSKNEIIQREVKTITTNNTEQEKSERIINLLKENFRRDCQTSTGDIGQGSVANSKLSIEKKHFDIQSTNTFKQQKCDINKAEKESEKLSTINYSIKPINKNEVQIHTSTGNNSGGNSSTSMFNHYPGINLKILFKNYQNEDHLNKKLNNDAKKTNGNSNIGTTTNETIVTNSAPTFTKGSSNKVSGQCGRSSSSKDAGDKGNTTATSKNINLKNFKAKEEQVSFYTLSSSNELIQKNVKKCSNLKLKRKTSTSPSVSLQLPLLRPVETCHSSQSTLYYGENMNKLMIPAGAHGVFSGNISFPRKSSSKNV